MDPLFEVHMLNEEGKKKARALAAEFDDLLKGIGAILPREARLTREWEVARTKLEEACFFVKKAMANCKENQQT